MVDTIVLKHGAQFNRVLRPCLPYNEQRRLVAEEFLRDLEQTGAKGQGQPSLEPGALKPLAQLRITPRI